MRRNQVDAGADPNGHAPGRPGRGGGWTPLRCAVAGAANPPVVALLLERGAVPDDHDLYLAAYAGSADAARLLLERGAAVEARGETWNSHPLVWAAIGSSEQRDLNPHPDWAGTVQALLGAGANAADVTLSPDDDHPPSTEVAALLRRATATPRLAPA